MGGRLFMQNPDVLIIGAGAAGLFCAIEAAKRDRRVLVLEHNDRPGKKILISGGGRCNFTNLEVSPQNFLSQNPHFCVSALSRFTPNDFLSLVKKYQIPYYEKTLGQLFCEKSSKEILSLLLSECQRYGVKILTHCQINFVDKKENFTIKTNLGIFQANSLVIATGGLSFTKLGASDLGYQIAQKFGHRILSLKPGLVPLSFDDKIKCFCAALSGVSIPVRVSCGKISFEENLLFTHFGLSGPALLQISNYWEPGKTIAIDLDPKGTITQNLRELKETESKMELKNALAQFYPKNFAQSLCTLFSCPSIPLNQISKVALQNLEKNLHCWSLAPKKTMGYEKAEVTCGGVDTRQLSSKTMESKIVPGLFFIGEVVDVTGWLGGYNFQWAWASGFCAGVFV
jgi:predicted Rossmann fold flavoprotein